MQKARKLVLRRFDSLITWAPAHADRRKLRAMRPDWTLEPCVRGSRKGGRIGGRRAAESGQLAHALHSRWHTQRGIVNPGCALCANGR